MSLEKRQEIFVLAFKDFAKVVVAETSEFRMVLPTLSQDHINKMVSDGCGKISEAALTRDAVADAHVYAVRFEKNFACGLGLHLLPESARSVAEHAQRVLVHAHLDRILKLSQLQAFSKAGLMYTTCFREDTAGTLQELLDIADKGEFVRGWRPSILFDLIYVHILA